ncbi:hypothetical protein O9K51_10614 [Purpureocillium lavendulum]|uniref:Uncharacterized protein n=1 Tax=Purpureocillium lavendulum TaxID=1247861 RepID=A0AB34FDF6_9HYPO|nr:hypothetical protein O9K51_10614 [Purpureocillium lavendulum]
MPQADCGPEIIETYRDASWAREVQCSTQSLEGALGFGVEDLRWAKAAVASRQDDERLRWDGPEPFPEFFCNRSAFNSLLALEKGQQKVAQKLTTCHYHNKRSNL